MLIGLLWKVTIQSRDCYKMNGRYALHSQCLTNVEVGQALSFISIQGQCGRKREGYDESGHSSIDSETISFTHLSSTSNSDA